jgi:hypothetical protein
MCFQQGKIFDYLYQKTIDKQKSERNKILYVSTVVSSIVFPYIFSLMPKYTNVRIIVGTDK